MDKNAIIRALTILFVNVLLVPAQTAADDIEAVLVGKTAHQNYLHILLDPGDSSRDRRLCTYGVDCAPPFMTAVAHAHLQDMYAVGDAVTAPGMFKAVLAAVLENPLFNDFHFSLVIPNHHENRPQDTAQALGGGTILEGYKRLGDNRVTLLRTLKSIPAVMAESSHAMQSMEAYFEWSRYIAGAEVALGTNTRGNFGLSQPVPNYDEGIIENGHYLSPFADAGQCPLLYSILFSLDSVSADYDLSSEIYSEMALNAVDGLPQMLSYLHDNTTDLLSSHAANIFMQKTWVVTSRDRQGSAGAYAEAGGSQSVFYVDEPLELQQKLENALEGLGEVGSGMADVSFVADTFNAGSVMDSVYLPLFLAKTHDNWTGNLKKLKFSGALQAGDFAVDAADTLVDARGKPAFETVGIDAGRLRFDALTFWTDANRLPAGDDIRLPKNADGRVVARGGAGQKIDGFLSDTDTDSPFVQGFIGDSNSDRSQGGAIARQIFYEPSNGREFLPFDARIDSIDDLGPLLDPLNRLDDDALLDLIRWGRGQENGENGSRRWLLGEIIHSQAYALNYGATQGYSQANPNIRLFVGSGDGLFHIIENTDSNGHETGREVFGFYPGELLVNIGNRQNRAGTSGPFSYGVDGTPVVLRVDRNMDGTLDYTEGDEAYVYFGLRRGGDSYYALNVSNPAAVPSLQWKISAGDSSAFSELGLSFSTPLVGKVNYSGVPVDVLIFAGGYNGGWNADQTMRTGKDSGAADDGVGNAVFIVNARTGQLIWKAVKGDTGASSNTHYEHAELVDSIPSAVAALVTPQGIIHRLYVGDSGGAIWRVDLPGARKSAEDYRKNNWFITRLADLGFDDKEAQGSAAQDRRFFHPPDVVHSFDQIGDFDGVLIQSGDRAHPNETVVENYLFYLKDRRVVSGSAEVLTEKHVTRPADLSDQTLCVEGTEIVIENGSDVACGDRWLEHGWKLRYSQPGEKGLSSVLVEGGRVFASTFTPAAAGACPPQIGQGSMRVARLRDGTAATNSKRRYDLGSGIPGAAIPVGDFIYIPGRGIDLHDLDGDDVRDIRKLIPGQSGKLYSLYWREPGADPL